MNDLREMDEETGYVAPATGQAIVKVRYTHADMIDFIIANPGISQNAIAARYGYTAGWVSRVMSSDAFQSAMAARREEVLDPTLIATIDERFRALTSRSLDRLMEKLDQPQVSDQVVLRAVELGAKAMGVGGNAPPPPLASSPCSPMCVNKFKKGSLMAKQSKSPQPARKNAGGAEGGYANGVPMQFVDRDLRGVNPKTEQFEPTPAEPVRQKYKMAGGC